MPQRCAQRFLFLLAIMSFSALIHAQLHESGAPEPALEGQLKSLKNGSLCERRSAVMALHRAGIQAIPALIEHISDGEIAESSALLFQIPILSSRPPDAQDDYFAGVLYAYSVELILGRERLIVREGPCDFLLDPGEYVYHSGVIRKKHRRLIEASDLPRVQQFYSRWWGTNRNKTLTQLRQDWKQSARPLNGSPYSWY
jgi:hypothetical protein